MKRIYILLPVLMSALAVFSGCAAQANSAASDTQIVTVDRGNLKQEITPSGNLVMPHSANLNFGSGGTVTQVLVTIGDSVRKEQVLAKLDTLPLEQAVIQAQVSLKTAQLNLERAENPTVSATGAALLSTPDPLDIEIKKLQVESARLNLQNAQKNLDNAVMKAPFDGLIGAVNINTGDLVAASFAAIRLIDPKTVEVNAQVNEMDVYQIKVGSQGTVQIDALAGTQFPATVKAISSSGINSGGVVNFLVKLDVKISEFPQSGGAAQSQTGQRPAAGMTGQAAQQRAGASDGQAAARDIKEGLTVSVSIVIIEKNNVLRVPIRAIMREGRNVYVGRIPVRGVNFGS